MKSEIFEKFFMIFFVQVVAWEVPKYTEEFFFQNIHSILNAAYPSVENFKSLAPFFALSKINNYKINNILMRQRLTK